MSDTQHCKLAARGSFESRRGAGTFLRCESGASAVEFAIISPLFIVLLMGILAWGGYFWMSHSLQQLANDGARAAVGGLNQAERDALARATLDAQIGSYPFLIKSSAVLVVQESGHQVAVSLSYDASDSPFFALKGLVPMPSPTIVRQAATQLGGY